ncbi:MAG: hypothetical protein JJU22_06655 [Gammaproteobacteria bacterium]|nr:hypothetical protein [Gammaproteobacteria bacterium]
MNALLTLLVVVAGIHLSMRCIAAGYRILDLGYALRRERSRVARGLLLWFGLALGVGWVLPGHLQAVFAVSLLGYAGLHGVLVLLLTRVLLPLSWRRNRASALDDGRYAHAARGADGDQTPP